MSRPQCDDIRFQDLSLSSMTSGGSSLSVSTEMIQHNNLMMLQMVVEDLDFLEADLQFYEKVPVIFLLYGQKMCVLALQKLLIEIQNASLGTTQRTRTTLLSDWARKEEQWPDKLLEALCIANVNHAIIKLGLHLEEIRERYMPHIPELNLYIHPVLKALYIVAEELTLDEARNLIDYVNERSGGSSSGALGIQKSTEFLEISCLDWIQRQVIQLGDWSHNKPNTNVRNFCDLTEIIAYLKKIPNAEHLEQMLHNIFIRMNYTKHNQIAFETTPGGKRINQMDKMGDPIPPPETYQFPPAPPIPIKLPVSVQNRLNSDPSRYHITKKNAGYLLIINQNRFTPSPNGNFRCSTREGTDNDKHMLMETFKPLGYNVVVGENLSSDNIFPFIKNYVERSKDMDSIIICVLSHGTKGNIFFHDYSIENRTNL